MHAGYGIIRLMNQPSSPDTPAAKKQHIPKIFWIITVLFIVLLAGAGYLYATKQLVIAIGGSSEKPVTVVSSVCGKDTIKTFNDAYGAATSDARTAGFKAAFDQVNGTTGYASDPNCVFIRYTYFIELKDTTGAQKEVDVLKSLANKNLYTSSQLNGARSIESLQSDVEFLSKPEGDTQDGAGSDGQG